MTILRTIAPHPGRTSVRAGLRDLRTSIASARSAFGEGHRPQAFPREGGHAALDVLDVAFPMHDHPKGYELLDVAIGVDPTRDALVQRLMLPGRAGEALLLVEQAITGAVEHPPEHDHADLVAQGLAWTILDGRADHEAVIHRPTPWSAGRIRIGVRGTRRIAGPVKSVENWRWTTHLLATDAEQRAVGSLRKGTLVHPHGEDVTLGPTSIRLAGDATDAMTRLRAIAAWAEFERGRP